MNEFFTSIAALVVTLGLLIAFHEFGHYWTARKLGVKVLRYCIGFGKPLWKRRYGPDQIEYAIAAFPLGGYVKMLDEREGPVAREEQHRAFNRQPVWSRFAIVSAGPMFNFIFAIFAFWLMYMIGVPGIKPMVGEVSPDSVAAQAGLKNGDVILRINDETTPTWGTARIALLDKALDESSVTLTVRDGNGSEHVLTLPVDGLSSDQKQQDIFGHLGVSPVRPVLPAVLGELEPGGPAYRAGLESGDRILQVNETVLTNWMELVDFVQAHPDENLQFQIERGNGVLTIPVKSVSKDLDGRIVGRIGAAPMQVEGVPDELSAEVRYSFFESIPHAIQKTWQLSVLTIRMIGKMIVGDVSVKNLSGPITIATYAGYTASVGIGAFLYFLAVVSISLGVLNLLPIPMLDGGHLMYYLIEMVKGSPLSDAVQLQMQQVGVVLLFMLMAVALYNDVMRLFA